MPNPFPDPVPPPPADPVPRLPGADHTLRLLRQGYAFIPAACDRLGSDAFRTRLMGRPVLCLRGPEAQALVYGPGTTRQGAMPGTVLRLLQDRGSVQQLEGDAHRARKAVFLRLLTDERRLAALVLAFRGAWGTGEGEWAVAGQVRLMSALPRVLTRAVCHWAGIGLEPPQERRLAADLFAQSDRAGHVGPATLAALLRRRRAERRMRGQIHSRRLAGPDGSVLSEIAHMQEGGRLLPVEVAAVELLNVLRPVVAVGRYIAFAAVALARRPDLAGRFRTGDRTELASFCEEVRRTAPFFPMTGAVTTQALSWRGQAIPAGTWLLVDLWGTAQDGRWFADPQAFQPERGLDWRAPAPGFAPQGAGDAARGHRCPGEAVTLALMAEAVMRLAALDCRMPAQDLSVRLTRIPARPESGVLLRMRPPATAAARGRAGMPGS